MAVEQTLMNGSAVTDGPAPAAAGSKRIYIVRLPRPTYGGEAALQERQEHFNKLVDKVRGTNQEGGRGAQQEDKRTRNALRAEQRELRQRMADANAMKKESEPEYDAKRDDIKRMVDLHQKYINQLKALSSVTQDTDLKSEAQLEERIKGMEDRIKSGELTLREEKMMVQNVSKLHALRGPLKSYEASKEERQNLEAESRKASAIIADMKSEFNILKTERDSTIACTNDMYKRLEQIQKELKDLDEEEKELVDAKNAALASLQKAYADKDVVLQPYRENRRLATQLRDLVDAGHVDAACELASMQVEDWVGRLTSDTKLRMEYDKLWSEQRKYMVSDLLPTSSIPAQQELAQVNAARSKLQAKGAIQAKKGSAGQPPRESGAEQARNLIDSIMAQAKSEASGAKSQPKFGDEPAGGQQEEQNGEVQENGDSAPQQAKQNGHAKEGKKEKKEKSEEEKKRDDPQVENMKKLPKQLYEEDNFVPPVELLAKDKERQQMEIDEAQRKAQLREEQRIKQAEAEKKKKQAAEAKERKKAAAAEAQKRQEQEREEKEARAKEAAAAGPKHEHAEQPADNGNSQQQQEQQQQQQQRQPVKRGAADKKPKADPVPKRPKPASKLRTARKIWNDHQHLIVCLGVMLAFVIWTLYMLLVPAKK